MGKRKTAIVNKVNHKQENLFEMVFDGQDLTDSTFDRCNLHHCSFKDCVMTNVTFDRCNCIVCNFEGVNMDEINFEKTNIITAEEEERINRMREEIDEEPKDEKPEVLEK